MLACAAVRLVTLGSLAGLALLAGCRPTSSPVADPAGQATASLVTATPSPTHEQQKWAAQAAREHLRRHFATKIAFPDQAPAALSGLERAQPRTWPMSGQRWLVVFPAVELPCLIAWPEPCPVPGAPAPWLPRPSPSPSTSTPVPLSHRDIFVCVESGSWQVVWSGRSSESLGPTSPLPCSVPPTDAEWVEQRAREILRPAVGTSPLDRARVEVHESPGGWTVIFREAYAECGTDGSFWPGACRFQKNVFRDLHVCVERDGLMIPHGQARLQFGGALESASVASRDPCAGAFDPVRTTKSSLPPAPSRVPATSVPQDG